MPTKPDKCRAYPAHSRLWNEPVGDFLLVFRQRMLKFSRVRFCAEAGVYATGRAPDAGSFRTAASQLGTPRPHRFGVPVFVFRSDRAQNTAKAARESHSPAKDRPGPHGSQAETVSYRTAAFGVEDRFRRAHDFRADRRTENGSAHRSDAFQLRHLRAREREITEAESRATSA